MGISMFYQMRMTPMPSTDQMQAKMFRFMPLMFLFLCYNFSSGLVLYWTMSNVISIIQQIITNRKREREEGADEAKEQARKGGATQKPLIAKRKKKKKKPDGPFGMVR